MSIAKTTSLLIAAPGTLIETACFQLQSATVWEIVKLDFGLYE